MAIVKMKRLSLLAMSADKDTIYDALVKCNAVQLKRTADSVCPEGLSSRLEQQLEKVRRVEGAIAYLTEQAGMYNLENKHDKSAPKAVVPKPSFSRPLSEVDFDYFLAFGDNAIRIEGQIDQLLALRRSTEELEMERNSILAEIAKYSLVKSLPHPTNWYRNTDTAIVQLSQMPSGEWHNLDILAEQYDTVSLEKISDENGIALVVAVAHKSQAEFLEKAQAYGLVKCGISCQVLPSLVLKDLDSQLETVENKIKETKVDIVAFTDQLTQWKIYIDYLNLCVKKLEADCDIKSTLSTFILEGYYPADEESKVEQALLPISDCMILTFADIGEEEFAPTYLRNNKVVRNFEGITNMYSPPDYHEIDPNPIMSVFYFLIFGFMVADIGYGAVLCFVGLFATLAIKQRTGLKTMMQMFGFCGIAAIAVGALFGSCFSMIIFNPVIPDPSQYPMVMMIISILLGIVHMMAGIGCKMAVKIKHKQYAAAWLADFPWLLVFVGLIVAIWNMALGMAEYPPYDFLKIPKLASNIGLYVCLGALAVGVIFAGVGAKGFKGKAVKSFGSVYGIINYFSDAMSYVRVFGLMLSSALIGSVVNQLGDMVMGGGGAGYVLGAIVLVVAHVFNLAMGLLSVYIHNGRLQYVEFFGKFYTGEGQLFVPFGSDTQYTILQDKKVAKTTEK